ncbi:hypothetical protein EV702DRAFT_1053249 [Suillus placidus]|uniref:Uncharacterized protein n=1 Tax=Suillus placidus TaxID=48579 RepID=A0A9P6ZEZ7_9AGAM|nr:hypothetical protein EV702DRAFT_1053249 [Suillus placidus]
MGFAALLAAAEYEDDKSIGLAIAILALAEKKRAWSNRHGSSEPRQMSTVPVFYQLATFLCHLGGELGLETAGVMSVAEGTVYLYLSCICQALRNICNDHVFGVTSAPTIVPGLKFAGGATRFQGTGCVVGWVYGGGRVFEVIGTAQRMDLQHDLGCVVHCQISELQLWCTIPK